MTKYDPYRHAIDLGIQVFFRPLGKWMGLWFADQRTIVMRQDMGLAQERSMLTACLVHAESGSVETVVPKCVIGEVTRRLVNPQKVREAIVRGKSREEIAAALDVVPELIDELNGLPFVAACNHSAKCFCLSEAV